MPEDVEGDHLVKNAAELVAATHVADGHEVGIDRAGPIHRQVRLADLAQAAQSIQFIMQRGGGGLWLRAQMSEPSVHAHTAQGRRV